jgi:hypothetical protein
MMPLRILKTEVAGQITGAKSPNHTDRWDVYGTDLGHMFWHGGELYMVFGDTFGKPTILGKHWRSNTMARVADPDPRHGLRIETMITGPDGWAKELIPSKKIDQLEMTVIPTNGISAGGRMILHYMSVRHWDKPGRWTVSRSGLAYSDDDGRTWKTPAAAVWPGGTGFEQVAFVRHGEFIYSFGIPQGRFGGVRLRRVAPENILVRSAYQYWNGTDWVPDIGAAAVIVPAPVGELSVAWSAAHNRWIMLYLDPQAEAIVLRAAAGLTGPWGDKQQVLSRKDYPGIYAPFIVPGSDIDGDLYYTASFWGPYNVFLMHTRLEKAAPAIAESTPAPAGAPIAAGGLTATDAAMPAAAVPAPVVPAAAPAVRVGN